MASELAALSSEELPGARRDIVRDMGIPFCVFRRSSGRRKKLLNLPSLDEATPVLDKALVVDVGAIRCAGAKHPGPQPIDLENYEGMSLGPALEMAAPLVPSPPTTTRTHRKCRILSSRARDSSLKTCPRGRGPCRFSWRRGAVQCKPRSLRTSTLRDAIP